MKRTIKIFGVMAAIAAVFICGKTRQIQKTAGNMGQRIPYGPYEAVLKRPLDILIVGMALVPLAPVMGMIALLVRIKLGSPVLFRQERPGRDERIFTLYKFRTMTDEKDGNGELLPDEKRLTGFGKWLRSTSLDELPELFNILKGEMSLVGPRPQLVRDMVFMSDEHRKRHDVRPGLTGLAQVSGRNGISWENKLGMDLEYIEKITFLRDLKIILQTVRKVLIKEGINEEGQATGLDYGDWLYVTGQISRKAYVEKRRKAEGLVNEIIEMDL